MSNKDNISAAEAEAVAKNTARTRKILAWTGAGISAIVIGVLVYVFAFRNPAIEKGNAAIGEVDLMAYNAATPDSLLLEAYKNVADNHGYDAGNRAKFMTAAYYYRQGDNENALKYIEQYDGDDKVVASLAFALKGDCLVNLDRYDEAVKAFDKAIDECDGNAELIPYFLTKKAVIAGAQGKHSEAAGIYKQIEQKYPDYAYSSTTHSRMLQEEALAAAK